MPLLIISDVAPQTFFGKFRTDAVGATFQHVQVNGGSNNQNSPGVEVRQ